MKVTSKMYDLTDRRNGMLVAREPDHIREDNQTIWRCECDCGRDCYKTTNQFLGVGRKTGMHCGCSFDQSNKVLPPPVRPIHPNSIA